MDQPLEHRPVLFEETMQALAIRPDGVYVDGKATSKFADER